MLTLFSLSVLMMLEGAGIVYVMRNAGLKQYVSKPEILRDFY